MRLRHTTFYAGSTGLAEIIAALRFLFNPERAQGDLISRFENAFANYLGVEHAISFASGRESLFAILKALEVGEGDEVITPGYTCVVVSNAIRRTGATPVFADIEADSYNIDPKEIENKITPRTKAVIAQHTYGIPANLDGISRIVRRNNLKLIEDCAHALAAEYKSRKVGTFGDAAFFSMEFSKVISTGAGGIAVTNEDSLAGKIRKLQDGILGPDREWIRGKLLQYICASVLLHPAIYWGGRKIYSVIERRGCFIPSTSGREIEGAFSDCRKMADAFASLGICQLKKIDRIKAHAQEAVDDYKEILAKLEFSLPAVASDVAPMFLRYPVSVKHKELIFNFSVRKKFNVGVWFISVLHPAKDPERLGYASGSCPRAEQAVRSTINLPTHLRVKKRDIRYFARLSEPIKELDECES